MLDSIEKIEKATREELIQYLVEWGFVCGMDDERTEELRSAVLGCFQHKSEKK